MNIKKTIDQFEEAATVPIAEIDEIVTSILDNDDEEVKLENKNELKRLMALCFTDDNRTKVSGAPSEYHNLAVTFGMHNKNGEACAVIDRGLKNYPHDVDLLADYLTYGSVIEGNFLKCNKYYSSLLNIPRERWTWRAYDFSIDFLLLSLSHKVNSDYVEVEQLINEYKLKFTADEKPFIAEAKYYCERGNRNKEEEALKVATTSNIVSPLCSLRLAKIYFEKAEYEKADVLIERCKEYLFRNSSPSIVGQVYLLSVTCKMVLFFRSNNAQNNNNKTQADAIYSDYKAIMYTNVRNTRAYRNLSALIEIFSNKTGIPFND